MLLLFLQLKNNAETPIASGRNGATERKDLFCGLIEEGTWKRNAEYRNRRNRRGHRLHRPIFLIRFLERDVLSRSREKCKMLPTRSRQEREGAQKIFLVD
jgi:hypothetical protein